MVLANLATGRTESFDLTKPESQRALDDLIRDGSVRGLAIHHDGCQSALPMPRRFREFYFGAELVGGNAERIFCQADNVRVSLTRSLTSSLVRCDLARVGRNRFNPRELSGPRRASRVRG